MQRLVNYGILKLTFIGGTLVSRAAQVLATYLYRGGHQYAGTLPITAETYFLTFELLLPAGRPRRPVGRSTQRITKVARNARPTFAQALRHVQEVPLRRDYVARGTPPAPLLSLLTQVPWDHPE